MTLIRIVIVEQEILRTVSNGFITGKLPAPFDKYKTTYIPKIYVKLQIHSNVGALDRFFSKN